MSPSPFQSLRSIERLTDLAIGFSLAAITAVVFTQFFSSPRDPTGFITGAPTLLFGTIWALLLRWRQTLGTSRVRVGWLASIPLAMANAAVAAGLMLSTLDHSSRPVINFFLGMMAGATVGVLFWGPALLATLLCFGVPIAWGQRLAQRGLAGQERGDGIVGLSSAAIAFFSFLLSLTFGLQHRGAGFTLALGGIGTIAGLLSALLAWRRDRERRDFVAKVEAGEVPRFRVEPSAEGKVLVRIVSQGEGYRVADFSEEVARLDASGEVTRTAAR